MSIVFHSLSADQSLEELRSTTSGLSAREIPVRLEKYGPNLTVVHKEKSLFVILLSQLKSPIVFLLFGAAALSFAFGDFPESIAIVCVILINTLIGFTLEMQAVKSMEGLRKVDKITTRVFRDGKIGIIDVSDLVPGDIIQLEAGDIIPADARIIHADALHVNESILTGESLPIEKDGNVCLEEKTPAADRINMLYKGTSVTRGNVLAVVTNTGRHSEIGRISELTASAEDDEVPLNKKLNKFGRRLILLTLIISVIFIAAGMLRGNETYTLIETAIALAVAAIPEGLPIVATIAMARGMIRLSRRQVIVKKLEAVETLGETSMIITDKTGTLTENQLSVEDIEPVGSSDNLLMAAALCNNARYGDNWIGDPVEIALASYVKSTYPDIWKARHKRLKEIPFTSEQRFMATLNQVDGNLRAFVKGSPAEVLDHCGVIPVPSNEHDTSPREFWEGHIDRMAARGLKVLGFAVSHNPDPEDFISNLEFAGIVGLQDPPRPHVEDSVRECRRAGIKVIMATGDHPVTALEIGKQVGITDEGNARAVTGAELAEIPDWNNAIDDVRIFSRVTPAQKLELISFYQEKGNVVGMTGDGVNDAPALRKADIGIAMGIRGTQVAKEAADMVLQNDSFRSIVSAVRYGRIIYDNIRYFIIYLLSCNLTEILVVSIAAIGANTLALLPLQILFLNLVTDVFPALALGMGKGDPYIMRRGYREPGAQIISGRDWLTISAYSMVLTTGILGIYFFALYNWNMEEIRATSVAFYTLALAQLFHPFNLIPGNEKFTRNSIFNNRYMWGAILLCIIILVVISVIPVVAEALNLYRLLPMQWLTILLVSLVPVLLIRLIKIGFKKSAHGN